MIKLPVASCIMYTVYWRKQIVFNLYISIFEKATKLQNSTNMRR